MLLAPAKPTHERIRILLIMKAFAIAALGLAIHQICSHGVFGALQYICAAVQEVAMLEDQDRASFWLHINFPVAIERVEGSVAAHEVVLLCCLALITRQ